MNVTFTLYGKTFNMPRQQALDFLLDCIDNSEGAEQERYINTYLEIKGV